MTSPKQPYTHAVPIDIPVRFFTKLRKDPKIHIKIQKVSKSRATVSKRRDAGGLVIPDLRLHSRAIVQQRRQTATRTETDT